MPQQSTIDQARGIALKEDALDLMEKAKSRVFLETMRDHGRHLCLLHGSVSTDDIQRVVQEYGFTVPSSNIYGCIFRGHHWKEVGRKPSDILSNHGREIGVYQYVE